MNIDSIECIVRQIIKEEVKRKEMSFETLSAKSGIAVSRLKGIFNEKGHIKYRLMIYEAVSLFKALDIDINAYIQNYFDISPESIEKAEELYGNKEKQGVIMAENDSLKKAVCEIKDKLKNERIINVKKQKALEESIRIYEELDRDNKNIIANLKMELEDIYDTIRRNSNNKPKDNLQQDFVVNAKNMEQAGEDQYTILVPIALNYDTHRIMSAITHIPPNKRNMVFELIERITDISM